MKLLCWLGHRWKWTGRKRTYPNQPLPFYPLRCERCGETQETTRPEKYVREMRRGVT